MKRVIATTSLLVFFSFLVAGFVQVSNPISVPLSVTQLAPPRTLPHDVEYVPENIEMQEASIAANMTQVVQEPGWDRTSDFMLGTIAVAIILPECTSGCTQGGWENNDINHIMTEIQNGLSWWETQAAGVGAFVDFQIVTDPPWYVPTVYEPIELPGGGSGLCGEAGLWIDDVMGNLGYNDYSGEDTYLLEVRQFDNYLRDQHNTDWAITVFMVDSSNNPGGMFAVTDCNGQTNPFSVAAWAARGGPYTTLNTINNGFGEIFIDGVLAHEFGHVFGAPDEVDSTDCRPSGTGPSCDTQWGYLGGENQNCAHSCAIDVDLSMMRYPEDHLSGDIHNVIHDYTVQQLGWLDSDSDGLPNPIDTMPNLTLDSPPAQTSSITPQFLGSTEDIPFPAAIPTFPDETINEITGVEYRIDGGTWSQASPTDGAFNSALETFSFEPLLCRNGSYLIEVRSLNSVGHYSSIATHTITANLTETCSEINLPIILSGNQAPLSLPSYALPSGYPAPSQNNLHTEQPLVLPEEKPLIGGYPAP